MRKMRRGRSVSHRINQVRPCIEFRRLIRKLQHLSDALGNDRLGLGLGLGPVADRLSNIQVTHDCGLGEIALYFTPSSGIGLACHVRRVCDVLGFESELPTESLNDCLWFCRVVRDPGR